MSANVCWCTKMLNSHKFLHVIFDTIAQAPWCQGTLVTCTNQAGANMRLSAPLPSLDGTPYLQTVGLFLAALIT